MMTASSRLRRYFTPHCRAWERWGQGGRETVRVVLLLPWSTHHLPQIHAVSIAGIIGSLSMQVSRSQKLPQMMDQSILRQQ